MEKETRETQERGWGLHAFIMGLEDLEDEEKKLCYDFLDKEGFGARTKRRAFFSLEDAELRDAGISRASVRKVLRLAMASAAGLGVGSAAGVGAAGGQGTSQAGDAGAAAGLGVGSAAGAGSLPAAAAAVGMGGSKTADWPPPTAAGVAAGQSSRGTTDAGLLEALFPSTLYCITFTLYDGVDVAMRLVSHAKANGFRGKVRHVSTSRSDFTLLLKTDDEASKQTLKRFASWLATEVPVRAPAVATNAAFAKAEEEAVARVVVTSDLSNPLSSDRELLDMYGQGQLTVNAATEVQLALETAAKAVEQMERLSKSSLGKSMASSSHE